MPWDGAGNFTREHDWTDDEASGIDIEASRMDTEDDNFESGINACLAKNGENKATQINVDNLRLDGNTISSQNTDGNILIAPNGSGHIGINKYAIAYQSHGNMGSTETFDLDTAIVHEGTLDANCTFTFSNPPGSGKCGQLMLVLNQDATGSRTVTWPSSVKWASGSAPTLSTGAGDIDILAFFTVDGGTTWYGSLLIQDAS